LDSNPSTKLVLLGNNTHPLPNELKPTVFEGFTFFSSILLPIHLSNLSETLVAACSYQERSFKRIASSEVIPSVSQKNPGYANISILVADDNITNQKLVHKFLKDLGFEADFVSSGQEAIKAHASKAYDIIFMVRIQ
jgi:PleD family two-component response regulator